MSRLPKVFFAADIGQGPAPLRIRRIASGSKRKADFFTAAFKHLKMLTDHVRAQLVRRKYASRPIPSLSPFTPSRNPGSIGEARAGCHAKA
jgi:hypothetical protein